MSAQAWELIFLMFVLKLPIVYLVAVVVYAIRATPEPEEAALVPVALEPEPAPCPWQAGRRRPQRPDPSRRRALAGAAR